MLSDEDRARAPAKPPRRRRQADAATGRRPQPSARARPLWHRGLTGLARALTGLWLFVALAAAWWVLSAHSTSPGLPPLESILRRFWELWIVGDAKDQLAPSLEHFAFGYAIASIAGIGIGAALWSSRTARDATSPYIYFLYVLPTPVLVPAVEVIFGIGFMMKVVIIAFAAVWPTLLNTLDGMKAVDQVKLDSARVLGLSRARTVRSVVLPGAGPQIVAGLRGSLQVSIILMVVSEILASTGGIGYFISQEQQAFNFVDMWTGVLMLALVGTVLNVIFVVAEHRVMHWYYGARAAEGRR